MVWGWVSAQFPEGGSIALEIRVSGGYFRGSSNTVFDVVVKPQQSLHPPKSFFAKALFPPSPLSEIALSKLPDPTQRHSIFERQTIGRALTLCFPFCVSAST